MAAHTEIVEILLSMRFLAGSPLSEANIERVAESYGRVLADLPGERVRMAALEHQSTDSPYFPSPGKLRSLVMEQQFRALGIPSAAEAWAMVQNARQHVPSVFCEEGAELREAGLANQTDARALLAYRRHREACQLCTDGGLKEVYPHPAVEKLVDRMGGRDGILTDNEAADRARFMDAYREFIENARREAVVPAQVRGFIESQREKLRDPNPEIKRLADRLEGKNEKEADNEKTGHGSGSPPSTEPGVLPAPLRELK